VYEFNTLTDTYDLIDTYTSISGHSKASCNDGYIMYYIPDLGRLVTQNLTTDAINYVVINTP